ncbi:hypothetical protein HSBAA_14390 [Vreelandella sulfidaeris]|uniref:Uncharacterized protein n=1 Tax=Vreelandella sulfidaeris TaxID=115553 RepID=A0A455U4J4_9GAMM|nr:hypothetical protein HSBAA_14390 [Halomonas sulfidaeris]
MERTTQTMLVSANKLRHARQELREENSEIQESAVALCDQLHEMIDLSDGILKRLRRNQPDDESFKSTLPILITTFPGLPNSNC